MRIPGAFLCGIIALAAAVSPAAAQPLPIDSAKLLELQNKYRAELGVPPLRWSDKLARGAQNWAETIAALDRLQHSGTSEVGENLAMWSNVKGTMDQLVGMWGAEKAVFTQGRFPDVSSTGDWKAVAHYTQMIWRDTTEVGCGLSTNGKSEYLVCWYDPQGNFMGRKPY